MGGRINLGAEFEHNKKSLPVLSSYQMSTIHTFGSGVGCGIAVP